MSRHQSDHAWVTRLADRPRAEPWAAGAAGAVAAAAAAAAGVVAAADPLGDVRVSICAPGRTGRPRLSSRAPR